MARCYIEEAIALLFPGQSPQYSLDGESLDGLEWLDTVLTQPTDAAINAKLADAEAARDATAYVRAREAAMAAQGITAASVADALYKTTVDDDSTDLDAIAAKRESIKEDNPTPEEV